MNFAKPSDVLNLDSSALHPDFKILWNISIFQRIAYHSIFSIASDSDLTGKLVNSFQKFCLCLLGQTFRLRGLQLTPVPDIASLWPLVGESKVFQI